MEIDSRSAKIDGVHRAYGQPANFEVPFRKLYRNDGNGHFTEISCCAGLHIKNPATGVAQALGVAPVDLDRDSCYRPRDRQRHRAELVFHNERRHVH